MKGISIPICIITTIWILAACAGKPEAETVSESAVPAAAETASSSALVGNGCYASIPLVAGSQEDAQYQADTDATILAMGGKADWFPGERLVDNTSKSTDAVLEYFKTAMLQNGWEESSNISLQKPGFCALEKGGIRSPAPDRPV